MMEAKPGRLVLFNPDLLTPRELEEQFVVRTALLQRLLDDLRRPPGDEGPAHHLIVGQRGMGKTTLLRRLRFAVEADSELSGWWLPLTFPEEQYGLATLADLWLNCLDALGDALDRRGREAEAAEVDGIVCRLRREAPEHRARAALDALLDWAREHEIGLVLLLDNLDLVFDRLKNDHWALREALSHHSRLVVIGGSAAAIESTYTYEQAFYDFFEIHELRGLTLEETRTLLTALSSSTGFPDVIRTLENDPGRLETLHLLTGGSPRAIATLFQVLATHEAGDVSDDIERLLDQMTPFYKARVDALPDQAQRIYHALALHWDPMTAADVAEAAGLPSSSQASAQLDRLSREGLVEQVYYPSGGKAGYQIAERFFNIWYLMRGSRRDRRRLIWLVEFLKLFYGSKLLASGARGRPCCALARDSHDQERQASLWIAELPTSVPTLLVDRYAEGSLALRRYGRHEAPVSTPDDWNALFPALQTAARTGHPAEALGLLEAWGLERTWRPARIALQAAAEQDVDVLYRVAPEVRAPALEILESFWPEGAKQAAERRPKPARRKRSPKPKADGNGS